MTVTPEGRGGAPSSAGVKVRLPWVDATRGYSVAAVVLFHVVLWGYLDAGTPVADAGRSLWGTVNSLLGSVRMPVMLAVSGLVLARRIRVGPLRHGTLVRSARNYYLYVVWLLVYAVFFAVFTQPYLRHRVDGVEVVQQLVIPATTLWYLFAIAAYSLVLTAVRRWPPWLVLSLLAALSVAIKSLALPADLWQKIPELFIFYAVGVYGAGVLRRVAEHATVVRILLAAVVAAGVTKLGQFTDGRVAEALLSVSRGVAFLVLAVLCVAVAVRWSPLRRLGVALGRQTLGIYVLHPLWIGLLTIMVAGPGRGVFSEVLDHPVSAVAYPAVATAVIIAVSMPVRALAERARLGWLFALPTSWEEAPARFAERRLSSPGSRADPTPSTLGSTSGAWAPADKELI